MSRIRTFTACIRASTREICAVPTVAMPRDITVTPEFYLNATDAEWDAHMAAMAAKYGNEWEILG